MTADAPRGFDPVSLALAVVTTLFLAWTAWLRFGPPAAPEPPAVGATAPALRLLDAAKSEPLVLLGLRGKVVWITFWSADPKTGSGAADLAALETVWSQFKPHARFAMAALDVDADRPDRLRAAVAATGATLPVYLAAPETCRAYGVDRRHLPLHVLLDTDGRVGAVSQGADPATLTRLSSRARRWLDEIEPTDTPRFANLWTGPRPRPMIRMTAHRAPAL